MLGSVGSFVGQRVLWSGDAGDCGISGKNMCAGPKTRTEQTLPLIEDIPLIRLGGLTKNTSSASSSTWVSPRMTRAFFAGRGESLICFHRGKRTSIEVLGHRGIWSSGKVKIGGGGGDTGDDCSIVVVNPFASFGDIRASDTTSGLVTFIVADIVADTDTRPLSEKVVMSALEEGDLQLSVGTGIPRTKSAICCWDTRRLSHMAHRSDWKWWRNEQKRQLQPNDMMMTDH